MCDPADFGCTAIGCGRDQQANQPLHTNNVDRLVLHYHSTRVLCQLMIMSIITPDHSNCKISIAPNRAQPTLQLCSLARYLGTVPTVQSCHCTYYNSQSMNHTVLRAINTKHASHP